MITSRSNPKIKFIRSLKAPKTSRAKGFFLAEGVRLVEEALNSPELIHQIFFSKRCKKTERGSRLLEEISKTGKPREEISEGITDVISETESPQGVFAIMKRVEAQKEPLLASPGFFGVLLYQLQDPGNVGSIIRVAEATGLSGVFCTREGVDPFQSKVVRSSMGSIFRMPIGLVDEVDDFLVRCRKKNIQIVSTSLHSVKYFGLINYKTPTLLVFGKEGSGLPLELSQKADHSITIPMNPPCNSLNVTVAAGIILYEAARQRGLWKLKTNIGP